MEHAQLVVVTLARRGGVRAPNGRRPRRRRRLPGFAMSEPGHCDVRVGVTP
jgi:hypothetical protein